MLPCHRMQGLRRDRIQLAEFEERAAGIVGRAGALLLEHYTRTLVVEFKNEARTDPVTAADRAVEQQVRAELRAQFPSHGFLGEEGTEQDLGAECVWVLDPLDGTANFAGRLPFFGVSLALLRNGVPVVGCLFIPFGPNLGSAVLRCSYGNGASLDGEPLRPARHPFRPTGPVALPPGFGWMFTLSGDLAKRRARCVTWEASASSWRWWQVAGSNTPLSCAPGSGMWRRARCLFARRAGTC